MDRSGSFRQIIGGSPTKKASNYDNYDDEANLGAPPTPSMPTSASAEFNRKKSLIRPERARIDRDHPQYHYAHVAAQQAGRIQVQPSSTGNDPIITQEVNHDILSHDIPLTEMTPIPEDRDVFRDDYEDVAQKGGRNVYGLNDEIDDPYTETPYAEGEYGDTYKDEDEYGSENGSGRGVQAPLNAWQHTAPIRKPLPPAKRPISLWHAYCRVITFWAPSPVLKLFGMKTTERQSAWREKMGLITIILYVAAFVAFLTFGFTASVCKSDFIRIRNNEVNNGYLIINGRAYDLTGSEHPAAQGVPKNSNILYPPVNAGGLDGSFLFQNVNGHCKDLITPKKDSKVPSDSDGNLAWYFPCQLFAQNGTTKPNFTTNHYEGWACHTSVSARDAFYGLIVAAEVYFTWDDMKNSSRHLVVYNGDVLDLDLLDFIVPDLNIAEEFTALRNDSTLRGTDISQFMSHGRGGQVAKCLSETIKVGYIDTEQIGCLASQVVLYVSLVFIIGLVGIKFLFACYFKWFISGRQGAFYMDRKQLEAHNEQIEDWSNDIYTQAPVRTVVQPPRRRDRTSKYGSNKEKKRESITMLTQNPVTSSSKLVPGGSVYNMGGASSRNSVMMSNMDAPDFQKRRQSFLSVDTAYAGAMESDFNQSEAEDAVPSESYDYVVPQPPIDFQPFGFPLAHTICLVTAYSESVDGLRTTLDSIATTDYPNSHKLIFIVCDGLIKGAGNDETTPEIALSMMTDFALPPDDVQAFSYVSVVSGSKRHNMAKVYSGFYKYDNSTIEPEKQQRVPVITIVKCGTPAEEGQSKPGNRGKRDSQVILMSFLQKVMFDERMTELEYEIFNGVWKITGIAPDFYEVVLMVDADTKVFPDSITHMVAEMVKDPEIMGLCGETKIANKRQSWVTMIQVFEYFISHHQAKAFESVFGGVTCLPGCFCMYRIKAPKGDDGFWIPILANPDIVERYSENVVDTLHKKNLLLLGEDRFLSTLMLRTFPKRKQIFVPKAACKTIVPDEFSVLLSQRRRWINSTVHNLMELVLVRDLCGVFIISMQFVVFVDLVSTLVLPAAISFTLYVIIISIVRKPTPVLSLVLLALILGLPGVLIVITASRLSYVLWMFIYLLSLPVWNFVLPMNAYWKFDDFSWGDTRAIQGGDKGHDDAAGEFDSSHIIMKRWRDFQKERGVGGHRPMSMGRQSWQPYSSVSMMSATSLTHGPTASVRSDAGRSSPASHAYEHRPEDMIDL